MIATDPVPALVLDLLRWLETGPRPYDEVMEAWRTSCPRLTVWEDAVEQGLVDRQWSDGAATVELTAAGRNYLGRADIKPKEHAE